MLTAYSPAKHEHSTCRSSRAQDAPEQRDRDTDQEYPLQAEHLIQLPEHELEGTFA